jgi:hypothetical protein
MTMEFIMHGKMIDLIIIYGILKKGHRFNIGLDPYLNRHVSALRDYFSQYQALKD